MNSSNNFRTEALVSVDVISVFGNRKGAMSYSPKWNSKSHSSNPCSRSYMYLATSTRHIFRPDQALSNLLTNKAT